ncbi:hypothetical protein RJ639_005117 [Escallonia herrerae]|uniref:Chromo domain-containing protein n=1 Tax=Escallonia herrerae TaxID=1293975 RepID=A0AA88W1F4_9ASTE|nr:hypothetical protein RJ639_005117 [Escallonia herrerae]
MLKPFYEDTADPSRGQIKRQGLKPKAVGKRVAEAILNDRVITASRKCHQEYIVKWQRYMEEENTWERVADFSAYTDKIEAYQMQKLTRASITLVGENVTGCPLHPPSTAPPRPSSTSPSRPPTRGHAPSQKRKKWTSEEPGADKMKSNEGGEEPKHASRDGIQLTVVNKCKERIWPGILGTAGHQTPNDGGFHLYTGEQQIIQVPENWSGRLWGRQGCCFDEQTGKGLCQTGDCAGLLHCSGTGGVPPATVVELTLGTPKSASHFYDVSLVDGFNLPVSMAPVSGRVGCGVAACEVNLNSCCPWSLAVKKEGKVVGCKSACLATKADRYCCTGEFANPTSCKPTVFANLFKAICPRAYSYAYDELTGLKTCRAQQFSFLWDAQVNPLFGAQLTECE